MFNKFIHRPVLSIVISLIITLLGVIALLRLPVTQFPSISPPKVNIVAEYPGANGELMVKAVVIPIERAINGVPGIKYIASDAGNDGEASIQVVFNSGTDPNVASLNIQNRVASVINKLPPIVVREGVKISREESNMLMYVNLYSKDTTLDVNFLYNFADLNLLSEIKRIDGVGFADILGDREYAMRIWLKPDRLAQLKLTTGDVARAITEQNAQFAAGKVGEPPTGGGQEVVYNVTTKGRLIDARPAFVRARRARRLPQAARRQRRGRCGGRDR